MRVIKFPEPTYTEKEKILADHLETLIRQIVRDELASRQQPLWPWVPAKEAGELLGISAAAVGQRVRQGTLPGRLYGRRIYVDRVALDASIRAATLPRSLLGADPEHK